ncbi:hypothetical protein Pelo_1709 [Pelomyxa schiedti]|nr:hypothetical protein Pelo_1709 [Pelomyxa schiedti]
MRSNTTAFIMLGDSLAMQWYLSLDDYGAELGVTTSIVATSNVGAKVYTWYGLERVKLVKDPWLDRFENIVFVVTGYTTPDLTMASFNKTVSFWASIGYVVIVQANPLWPYSVIKCIQQNINLTNCTMPEPEATDYKYYKQKIDKKEWDPNRVSWMIMNFLQCWDGTCHPNAYDIPIVRDGVHLSQPMILWKFVHQLFMEQIDKTPVIRSLRQRGILPHRPGVSGLFVYLKFGLNTTQGIFKVFPENITVEKLERLTLERSSSSCIHAWTMCCKMSR